MYKIFCIKYKKRLKRALSVLVLFALFLQTTNYKLLTPHAFAQEIPLPSESPTPTTIQSITPSPAPIPAEVTPVVVENTGQTQTGTNDDLITIDDPSTPTSATFAPPKILRSLFKRNFKVSEKITFSVANADITDFTSEIVDIEGNKIEVGTEEIKVGSDTEIQLDPPRSFRPGKYKIRVKVGGQVYEQDFMWGVLAINTNKSMYLPGELAKLAIAVLDDKGEMVCSAKVTLDITSPSGGKTSMSTEDGKIKVNPNCYEKKLTLIPDYEADLQLTQAIGTYNLKLTAETFNGTYSIEDFFQVKSSVDFDVERISATRLYPPLTYPVTFKIKADRDFSGKIVELVPDSFGISQLSGVTQYSEVKATDDETLQKESVLGTSTIGYPFEGEQALTQGFGTPERDILMRKLYYQFGVAGHDGMDFGVPEGTTVLSVDDGKVAVADYGGTYGATIVIEHAWGKTYYGHLSEFEVKVGDTVTRGQKIALSGSTGLSTGPHLHFGVKLNSNNFKNGYYGKVNPAPYLGIKASAEVLGTSTVNQTFQTISWDINVKKGQEITLGYQFKAPPLSPQLYRLGTLRFYESGNVDPVFEEARQWMLANDAPNNQFVKSGSFSKRTTSGSQTITGLGFKPKAIIFFLTNQTSAGTQSPSNGVANSFGIGMASSSSGAEEYAMTFYDEAQNNVGTTDTGRTYYGSSSIQLTTTNGGLLIAYGDISSFDADGFTINWFAVDSNAYLIHYIAFSETIIQQATVGTFQLPSGGSTITESDLTFQPDFVFFMTPVSNASGSIVNVVSYSMGAATSATSEWAISGYKEHNVDSTDTCTAQRTDASIFIIASTAGCTAGTQTAAADFTGFTSNGFTLNVSDNPDVSYPVFYLALKGNGTSFAVNSFSKPTSTGNSSVSNTGFQPAGLMFFSRNLVSSGTIDQSSNGILTIGTTSGVNQENSFGMAGADNEDVYDPSMRMLTNKSYVSIETDADTVTGEANLKSFDSNGFTLNWTTADATADEILYWAISDPISPPTGLMRHGKWFNESGEQPFAF